MHTASPELYEAQFNEKITRFKNQLATLNLNTRFNIEAFQSPKQHYRMRAEFKIWHDGDTAHYAMFNKGEPKKPIFIEQFPVASLRINKLMPLIMGIVNANEVLKRKLFQIDFLDSGTEDCLVTFIYHKKLDDAWIEQITSLKNALNIHVVGRSRKQKLILDQDFVIEKLLVNEKTFTYQQIENSFTQPNARVCEHMLTWAVNNSRGLGGDLLELYCGNGNFTLPLSENFNKVLATEISKTSVNSARYNATINKISNVNVIRMSSEEFCEAMAKKRAFTRLKDIDLDSYNLSTIFVDPPRAGLDDETINMVKAYKNIIYISCNPETLVNNLDALLDTHDISKVAVFDQFPYTEHLDSGVILKIK